MADESPDLLGLKVAAILDRVTIAVSGPGAGSLSTHEFVLVLATGQPLPGSSTPLVVPKAELMVESVGPDYFIAKTAEVRTELSATDLWQRTTRSVYERQRLRVQDEEIVGNPANAPVRVGDPVIRKKDLVKYAKTLK